MKKGFTLIELIISLGILSFVIAIIILFSNYFFQGYQFTFQENQIVSETQASIRSMTREIREMRDSEEGTYPLEYAGDREIIFYSDIDGDHQTDRIRYFTSGKELKKGVTYPSGNPPGYDLASEKIEIITSSLKLSSDSIFTYYNGSWPSDTANNPLSINSRLLNTRLIKISLALDTNENSGPDSHMLNTSVQLRNIKTNL